MSIAGKFTALVFGGFAFGVSIAALVGLWTNKLPFDTDPTTLIVLLGMFGGVGLGLILAGLVIPIRQAEDFSSDTREVAG